MRRASYLLLLIVCAGFGLWLYSVEKSARQVGERLERVKRQIELLDTLIESRTPGQPDWLSGVIGDLDPALDELVRTIIAARADGEITDEEQRRIESAIQEALTNAEN